MTLAIDSTVYLSLDAVIENHLTLTDSEESMFSPVAHWYQRWVELVQLARDVERIFLNRQPTVTTQGINECRIRTESSETTFDSFYIGVYDADSGQYL